MLGRILDYAVNKFRHRRVSYRVSILICLFASCSWLAIDGIFVELPLLVKELPEEWQLPSNVAIVVQLANIGPVLYTLITKYYPNKFKETPSIFLLMFVGLVSCILLVFVWPITVIISGTDISLPFYMLVFFISLMACTSSVTFYPFMARFKQEYLTAFFVGQGLCGLIPSILALIQGGVAVESKCLVRNITMNGTYSGKETIVITHNENKPEFGVNIFFVLLAVMVFTSIVSFLGLNVLSIAKNERIKKKKEEHKKLRLDNSSALSLDNDINVRYSKEGLNKQTYERVEIRTCSFTSDIPEERLTGNLVYQDTVEEGNSPILSQKETMLLLFVQAWINAFSNGIFPAASSYASIPYGSQIFHLLITLSTAADPLACFIHNWLPMQSVKKICVSGIVYTFLIVYVVMLGLMSPCPIMMNSGGGAIVICVGIIGVGLVSYLRLAISTKLHYDGRKALLWMGISIQVGSSIGALIAFAFVNFSPLFKQANPCLPCM